MNLRDLERDSIRAFVQSAADDGYLSGRVLDYGCGKQPYREIVEATGGEYVGYDRVDFPGSVADRDHGVAGVLGDWGGEEQDDSPLWTDWGAILCTQVVQYHRYPEAMVNDMRGALKEEGGSLVLTYPTNWPEVEPEDLHRFTKAGMERMLTEAGFSIVRHDVRLVARLTDEGTPRKLLSTEWLATGYGVIARA